MVHLAQTNIMQCSWPELNCTAREKGFSLVFMQLGVFVAEVSLAIKVSQ